MKKSGWKTMAIVCASVLGAGCSAVPKLDSELAACTAYLESPALESVVNFENHTEGEVSLNWVTVGSGNVRQYKIVGPDEKYSQETFVGHLWLVRGVDSDYHSTYCVKEAVATFIVE